MIELLEHNVETYKNLCDEMEKHNKVALIQATGTGKSYIISKYIEEHCHNALILVPANAIGDQWQKLLPDVEVKTYQAMAKGIDGEYDLIVADEMHHLGSDVWGQKFIEYFMQNPEQKVIGATATEIRYLDNARDMVEEIFNGIVVRGVDLATAIDKGILPTFKYVTAYFGSEKDFNKYREKVNSIQDSRKRNDFSKKLEMCIQNRASIKTAMYENLNMKKHNIIVFLNGLCEVDKAIDMFTEIFPGCECNYVSSEKSNKGNENSIRKFQQSDRQISILFAINILNEGVHIDGTDVVVMFRNTESPQVYFQQMGRVLDAKGCKDKIIFDFACNEKTIRIKKTTYEDVSAIESINRKVRNKERKIIIATYTKGPCELFQQISDLLDRKFTQDEDDFIRKNHTKMTVEEMAKKLNRSIRSVYDRKHRLGVTNDFKRWSSSEDSYIKEKYGIVPTDEIAKNLGRSIASVRYRISILDGLPKLSRIITDEQEEFLRNNAESMTLSELSKVLKLKEHTIYAWCRKNEKGFKKRRIMNKVVLQIQPSTGMIINKFESYATARKSMGYDMGDALRGHLKTSHGYIWEYEETEDA